MTRRAGRRPSVEPPTLSAPPPFIERRVAYRRAADRLAHEEASLLARALDVLANGDTAGARLAGLLDLLAQMVGASRAAVLANGTERRVAVAVAPEEDPSQAEALAAWLDSTAPRSRAARAGSGPAAVSFAVSASAVDADLPGIERLPRQAVTNEAPVYRSLDIPAGSSVLLGFEFPDDSSAEGFADRLPPALRRHAAVALALVSDQLATERELSTLRARDVERSRFVSTVAHELRTPLTGLSGYLGLILSGDVDDPTVERDFLERSQQIAGTMGELVADLLEISRIEAGSLRVEASPFSVAEVGQRVVDHLAPIALSRNIDLRANLPPRLRAATGDRRRVEQILVNLVGNALKFTHLGGFVEIAGWFEGPAAVIAVRDDGSGIEVEERDRIFERFYRLAGHERVTGTGLGLPIARELARAMGGDLGLASRLSVGSSFVLVLPGPLAVDEEVMASTMTRVVAAEEVRLEERAILRSLQALSAGVRPAWSSGVAPEAPKLALLAPKDPEPIAGLPEAGGRSAPRRLSVRRVRLHALDGGPTPESPSPA